MCPDHTLRVKLIPKFELRSGCSGRLGRTSKALFQSALSFAVELVPPKLLEDLVNKFLLAESWDTEDNLALPCSCTACSRYLTGREFLQGLCRRHVLTWMPKPEVDPRCSIRGKPLNICREKGAFYKMTPVMGLILSI